MIGRLWRGIASPATAGAYEEHLRTSTFPELARIEGYGGGYVLRRAAEDEVEFVVLTLWESLDSVRAFAGPDYDVAVVPVEAARLLETFDERALHYDVVVGRSRRQAAASSSATRSR